MQNMTQYLRSRYGPHTSLYVIILQSAKTLQEDVTLHLQQQLPQNILHCRTHIYITTTLLSTLIISNGKLFPTIHCQSLLDSQQ
jgi:hypothetical protein